MGFMDSIKSIQKEQKREDEAKKELDKVKRQLYERVIPKQVAEELADDYYNYVTEQIKNSVINRDYLSDNGPMGIKINCRYEFSACYNFYMDEDDMKKTSEYYSFWSPRYKKVFRNNDYIQYYSTSYHKLKDPFIGEIVGNPANFNIIADIARRRLISDGLKWRDARVNPDLSTTHSSYYRAPRTGYYIHIILKCNSKGEV